MAVLLLAGMVIGCSPEALDNVPLTESDVPIQLPVTRVIGISQCTGYCPAQLDRHVAFG